jgi:hypothetical protein
MADQGIPQNLGGQYNSGFAGGNTSKQVLTGSGRLCRMYITTAGTASLSIYDGTSQTGTTLIFTSLTNDPLGTVKSLDLPVSTGIFVLGTTGAPGVCLSYNNQLAYGGDGL